MWESLCLVPEEYVSSLGVTLSINTHENTVCSFAKFICCVPGQGYRLQESQESKTEI